MVVTFYAPEKDERISEMRRLANEKGTSFSDLIREAIEKYLEEGK